MEKENVQSLEDGQISTSVDNVVNGKTLFHLIRPGETFRNWINNLVTKFRLKRDIDYFLVPIKNPKNEWEIYSVYFSINIARKLCFETGSDFAKNTLQYIKLFSVSKEEALAMKKIKDKIFDLENKVAKQESTILSLVSKVENLLQLNSEKQKNDSVNNVFPIEPKYLEIENQIKDVFRNKEASKKASLYKEKKNLLEDKAFKSVKDVDFIKKYFNTNKPNAHSEIGKKLTSISKEIAQPVLQENNYGRKTNLYSKKSIERFQELLRNDPFKRILSRYRL